ncbi:MAG TPA: hypothetical protein VM939_10840 [Gemmatimonadaceae bacterium]|nr:hypothetical protein [Gemmatimonadaceae bacterium]
MLRLLPRALMVLATAACGSAVPVARDPGRAPEPARVTDTETSGFIRLSDEPSAAVVIDAPLDRVWALLPGVYETIGVPGDIDDAAARVYGTRRFSSNRLDKNRTDAFVRCGNEGAGPSAGGAYRMRLAIVSSLRTTSDDRTLVATEFTGSAVAAEGTSTGVLRCVSNGALEQRIRALLTERLKAAPRP